MDRLIDKYGFLGCPYWPKVWQDGMNCVQGIEIFLAKFQTLQEILVKIKNFYLAAQA